MIPILLGASMAGNIVGSLLNRIHPGNSAGVGANNTSSFAKQLNQLTSPSLQNSNAPSSGILTSMQWNQSSAQQLQSYLQGLTGSHMDATDASGKIFSGSFGGVFPVGNTLALNIGGQLLSLSQLKQISWSPSV